MVQQVMSTNDQGPMPHKRDLAVLCLQWIVAHSIGAGLVWAVPVALNYISLICFGLGGIGTGFLVGLCLGGLEAWILRRYLKLPSTSRLSLPEAWTTYSCVGGGLGYLLFIVPALIFVAKDGYPLEIIPPWSSWALATGLLGLLIWGTAQWYAIRNIGRVALLWIPTTVLSWIAGFYVSQLVTEPLFQGLSNPDPGLGLDYPFAILVQVCLATTIYGLSTGTIVTLYIWQTKNRGFA
jgi:hypothetical protein